MVGAHLVGMFPRSEELVAATRGAVRGKISQTTVDEILHRDVVALGQLQSDAQLDSFIDGQLNWQDLFRPLTELFTGIQPGTLTRWFDNNSFFRKPIVVEKVAFKGADPKEFFLAGLLPKVGPKRAILPGPFTFAKLSENRAYGSLAELIDDLAHALRDISLALQRAGFEYFQFNEPALCSQSTTQSELKVARQAFEVCAKGIGRKTVLQTYFGDASSAIDSLLDFPVDAIGLDFYATSLDSLVDHDFNKELGCGCIDGRNSLLESASGVSRFVADVLDKLHPKALFLSPNCDLDFLPLTVAEKKVRIIGEAKRLV